MKPKGIALVTGASRGLGRAVALDLAAAGFETVATMRRPEAGAQLPDLARERGGVLRVERLDVEDPASISMPDGLRVLVNNAGTEGEYLPVEHQPVDEYRRIFETNLFGLLEVTRHAIPRLRETAKRDGGGAVICNVTSSSYLAAVPFYAAYRASKMAVSTVGESLRAELAPFGIRIVEILPGPIETDMLANSDRMPEAHRHPEYRTLAERTYAGRKGVEAFYTPPEEAAAAIRRAILDDDAPLRNACDRLGEGMLEGWRSQSDEALMRQTGGDPGAYRSQGGS